MVDGGRSKVAEIVRQVEHELGTFGILLEGRLAEVRAGRAAEGVALAAVAAARRVRRRRRPDAVALRFELLLAAARAVLAGLPRGALRRRLVDGRRLEPVRREERVLVHQVVVVAVDARDGRWRPPPPPRRLLRRCQLRRDELRPVCFEREAAQQQSHARGLEVRRLREVDGHGAAVGQTVLVGLHLIRVEGRRRADAHGGHGFIRRAASGVSEQVPTSSVACGDEAARALGRQRAETFAFAASWCRAWAQARIDEFELPRRRIN
ncbi:unnamed protein product [Pelagomonas calceolata]|uniref:Uncharacterized protein n=1 Tax=Pelagomonas calceolata TaxID=35677 RepID=A0A8J2S554_9STRA|nr:unnamed protein product [Pelagomonas calceolata]|mmetsp:Transcript_20844/g.58941  ORF Transcript_20844/g.58941 Transcript_20844/m.58941 type:complete len:265 (-) Transcript_20844:3-797(-)